MNCNIYNNCGADFGDLEGHIHDMYGFFADKYSFDKHPDIHLDSDEQNKAEILGKTAYYDPQACEVHVYTDNRHPKDMLRSIAHELIHHKQNLEGRLQVGGYNGPGYYLENDKLKEVEHEAMLEGNACMREWEDTKKYKNPKESKNMSLNEWKNNELNQLLLKKFGILTEGKGKYDDGDGKDEKCDYVDCGDKKKDKKESLDEADCLNEKHCDGKDKLEEESETAAQKASKDKKISEPPKTLKSKMTKDGKRKFVPVEEDDAKDKDSGNKKYNFDKKGNDAEEKENALQEAVRRIAKAKKVFLSFFLSSQSI